MSAQMSEVSLLGVGTVLPLAGDAWSMVKGLRQATSEYAPPPPLSYGAHWFPGGVPAACAQQLPIWMGIANSLIGWFP